MDDKKFINDFSKRMNKSLKKLARQALREAMSQPYVASFGVIATSKLAKVDIADHDYTEGDKKHFTFEEALEVEKKLKCTGWRLPTRSEWALICEEFGQKDGARDAAQLMGALKLSLNGYVYPNSPYLNNPGIVGYYWSSTPNSSSANSAYALYFSSTNVNPSDYSSRYIGFSLRLVHDVEGKE